MQGDPKGAEAAYRARDRDRPEASPRRSTTSACCCAIAGELDEAIELLERAAAGQPALGERRRRTSALALEDKGDAGRRRARLPRGAGARPEERDDAGQPRAAAARRGRTTRRAPGAARRAAAAARAQPARRWWRSATACAAPATRRARCRRCRRRSQGGERADAGGAGGAGAGAARGGRSRRARSRRSSARSSSTRATPPRTTCSATCSPRDKRGAEARKHYERYLALEPKGPQRRPGPRAPRDPQARRKALHQPQRIAASVSAMRRSSSAES